MGQGCRGPADDRGMRIVRRMSRRMIRRTPRRMTRRPVPRTGSRRREPARQVPSRARPFRRVAPGESRPAGRARRPVPWTGSRRRAPARQAPVTRPPLPASRARRAAPGRPCPSVAPGARRAPRPFRDAAGPPRVQIKNIETASIRVSCDLRPLETLAFCAAAQDLGRCPKPRQGAKGSVSPVGCWAEGPKRPAGVSKYKGCARQRTERRYLRGQRNHECAERKRVPCGHLGQRPKATWRREQIQGLRAASAQNADICEGSETMSAPEGSVSPVGCCAQRKATRRREQIQGLRAASAQNADICERQGSAND